IVLLFCSAAGLMPACVSVHDCCGSEALAVASVASSDIVAGIFAIVVAVEVSSFGGGTTLMMVGSVTVEEPSPPPLTLAEFIIGDVAEPDMLTVTVIGG